LFTALLIAAPSLWLAYNAKQFGDPLDFIRGPYSARAIEARTTPPGASPHPGVHNMRDSACIFSRQRSWARRRCPGETAVLAQRRGHAGGLVGFRRRQIWPVLLLWLPLPFYAYSVAYGSVPIFIPVWRPFSWYNTRYGMELLPAFALFVGVPDSRVAPSAAAGPPLRVAGEFAVGCGQQRGAVAIPAVGLSGGSQVNSRSRIAFETALAKALLNIPGNGT
jgi:hypothetical protein